MSHIDPIRQRVLAIAEPVCLAAGYELVDVRFKSEPGGWVLRLYIDVAPAVGDDGAPVDLSAVPEDLVDLSDCENLSRELSAVLDVEDPIPHNYSLEVSSPGIDRPLRTPAHFRRYAGADIRVTMGVPLGDRRNFKGRLVSVETGPTASDPSDPEGAIAVVDVDGQTFRLRIADIDTARIVPDWDAVLKGGSGVGPAPAGAKLPKATKGHPKDSAGRRAKR